MKLLACVVGISVGMTLSGCASRRVATDFSALERRAPSGSTIYVTTSGAERLKGQVSGVSAAALKLSLRDGTTRDFLPADVFEIRVKDPLWNGLLITAGVTGLMAAALNDPQFSCIPSAAPDCRKKSRGPGIAGAAAVFGLIGAYFDSLHHRLVFRGMTAGRTSRLAIVPTLTPNEASIGVTLRR